MVHVIQAGRHDPVVKLHMQVMNVRFRMDVTFACISLKQYHHTIISCKHISLRGACRWLLGVAAACWQGTQLR